MDSIPFYSPETTSLKALRAPQIHLTEIKELPLEDPASKEETVEEEEQQGTSSSIMGGKPLQRTEEPHRDIPKGGEELPPRLEGKRQEQHEEDEGPFEIRDVFHGTLHNRKRQGEASEYFNSLSRKLQHLDVFPEEGLLPTTTQEDPSQSPIGVADALIVSQHMLLRQYQEYYARVTKEYVE